MDTYGPKPCSRVAALLHPTTLYINVTALANIDDVLNVLASEASNAPSPVPGSKISPWMPGVEIAVVAD